MTSFNFAALSDAFADIERLGRRVSSVHVCEEAYRAISGSEFASRVERFGTLWTIWGAAVFSDEAVSAQWVMLRDRQGRSSWFHFEPTEVSSRPNSVTVFDEVLSGDPFTSV